MPEQQPVFFFAAMSPFSWLAAERIGAVLPDAHWEPVFAGGLFKAAGRKSWGLDERREEQIRECERRAHEYGLGPIAWPRPWPTNDIHVARAMTYAGDRGKLHGYALGVMRAAFGDGEDLERREVLVQVGADHGIPEAELQAALDDPAVKQRLREVTDGAHELGVIGVPTVAVGRELFWGDDRLEEAARVAGGAPGGGPT
ncbi:MAG TPA: DsbA family protein [Solirubrobacteraceae bacterium]|nr:DsbA family protein [Solirubrobacteraceae bacterium]